VNKTLTKKFIYIITILALLAMMIPAMALPVSADSTGLTMNLVYGDERIPDGIADADNTIEGHNVWGSTVEVTGSGTPDWRITDEVVVPGAGASVRTNVGTAVQVQGFYGEVHIRDNNTNKYVIKKWGPIDHTEFTITSQQTQVGWNEAQKNFFASGSITDTVYGNFVDGNNQPAQGAVLNWYLVAGNADTSFTGVIKKTAELNAAAELLAINYPAKFVQFIDPGLSGDWTYDKWHHTTDGTNGWLGTGRNPGAIPPINAGAIQTVTDENGESTIQIGSWYMENVQIIVIPAYPDDWNHPVTPEIASYGFSNRQYEVVPQVRWAGEKIVLEANFGEGADGDVNFYLQNQSYGTLEGINEDNEAATIWTHTNDNGSAYAVLTSDVSGQVDVSAALYGENDTMTNQYAFRVYFLNFESLKLTDVNGKREGHDSGLWTPPNPVNSEFNEVYDPETVSDTDFPMVDPSINDGTTQRLNVSADALERVQVRGWFVPPQGTQMSTRDAALIDLDGDGTPDITAPYGRWVLPDDWAAIAGAYQWQNGRIHYDIMNTVVAAEVDPQSIDGDIYTYLGVAAVDNPLGDYHKAVQVKLNVPDVKDATGLKTVFISQKLSFPGKKVNNVWQDVIVATADVIGPFSPGLETMTTTGWATPNQRTPSEDLFIDEIQTVVPDGNLDAFDCPMPPAKIIIEILNGNGFFKEAMKSDIYYVKYFTTVQGKITENYIYTNPFYQELIPASPYIPAANKDTGGQYDWNSFDGVHGAYTFWNIISTPDLNEITDSDATHPTVAEVYSDNHGEAMIWLNGDWNLDLLRYTNKGGTDVPLDATVGYTQVQASADYPYKKLSYPRIFSNIVQKEWSWQGQILGTDGHDFGYDPITHEDNLPDSITKDTLMVLTAGTYTLDDNDTTGNFGFSKDKVVWVWACDRDGLQAGVLGTKVIWTVEGGAKITQLNSPDISNFNEITQNIAITNGFITPAMYDNTATQGAIYDSTRTMGESYLRAPTKWEKQLFYKNWGTGTTKSSVLGETRGLTGLYDDPTGVAPINFAVAAIDISAGAAIQDCTVTEQLVGPEYGNLFYYTNVDFTKSYPMDDPIIAGDANADGVVDAADITEVERIIMQIDGQNINADVNQDGVINMGDVVMISRILRGLD
jgi:hypothetical protein